MSGVVENLAPLLSAEDLYQTWLRANPDYRRSLFDGEPIGELGFRAFAKMWERVLQRVHEMHMAVLTSSATGATYATGTALITWTQGTTEGFDLLEGQILAQTPWGMRYRTTDALVVAAGQAPGYQRAVAIEAEWPGWDHNVDTRDMNQFAIPFADLCDELAGIAWGPTVTATAKQEFIDGIQAGEITVVGTYGVQIVGGSLATLDMIGSEKGLARAADETDAAYSWRIRRLPRTVVRELIMAEVDEYLAGYGIDPATMVEWFETGIVVGEWVVGDDWPAGPVGFVVEVPDLSSFVEDGIIVGEWVVGDDWVGDYTAVKDGILAGIDQIIRQAKISGAWFFVRETT